MSFLVPGRHVGDGLLLIYLQILASLTVNISRVYSVSNGGALYNSHEASGDDSDSEMDHEESNVEELQVSIMLLRRIQDARCFLNTIYFFSIHKVTSHICNSQVSNEQ